MCTYNLSLQLNGKWGRKSALIQKDTDLYKLKMYFIQLLIDQAYINISDDYQNNTPHIELSQRGDPIEFDTKYNLINNKIYKISLDSFALDNDFVSLNLGSKHMTLYYQKGLFTIIDKDTIYSILRHSLNFLQIDF